MWLCYTYKQNHSHYYLVNILDGAQSIPARSVEAKKKKHNKNQEKDCCFKYAVSITY